MPAPPLRFIIGASRTVAGATLRDDLGWRKLEERREEKKLLYGKRLGNLEGRRLHGKNRETEEFRRCWMVGRV